MSRPENYTHLLIARPCGWKMIAAETDMWLSNFNLTLGHSKHVNEVTNGHTSNARIAMGRNTLVEDAKAQGVTHILFIDPDMIPDAYLNVDPNAVSIWPTYWSFMKENPGTVLAAPYCGQHPREQVQIFSPNGEGSLKRISREQAAPLHGWHQIGGAGTGFMLIDMRVFDALTPPYFKDSFKDEYESALQNSQDVSFSKKCWKAGVPMYANFDCWCDHQQTVKIRRPFWVDPPAPPAPELIVR